MPKREFIISEENAQIQLDLFHDWYAIDAKDLEDAAKSGGGVAAVKLLERKLFNAIRWGSVEISEDSTKSGEPTLLVKHKLERPIQGVEIIEYKEVTGNARAAIKPGDDVNDTARMYQFLGVLSGQGAGVYRGLRGADVGITDALGFLFFQV